VFALYGKKTLLMGFDLRKPKIFEDFGLTNQDGISSYLVKVIELDRIIQHTEVANLDILMASPIPPQPLRTHRLRTLQTNKF
jgi:Mrp family chromosome partitioning ATPase